jgi:alkylhydroperoxidase/carboxymuconolactone decarboxylase family protein YurZ
MSQPTIESNGTTNGTNGTNGTTNGSTTDSSDGRNSVLSAAALAAVAAQQEKFKDPENRKKFSARLKQIITSADPAGTKTVLSYVDAILAGEGILAPENKLSPPEEALMIVGLLIGQDGDGGLHLAIHLYELMALFGMSNEKVVRALRVAQVYCGLPSYTAALRTMQTLMGVIVDHKNQDPDVVALAIVKKFGSVY